MYSIEQIQRGLTAYIDAEIASKLTGAQRWLIGGLGGLYASRLPEMVAEIKKKPSVAMLGLIGSNNEVDVDALHAAFKAQAERGSASFDIPMLGTITLTQGDIERLYRYIQEGI